jgi:glycosyltransferase involved in cell wall biosynthesis
MWGQGLGPSDSRRLADDLMHVMHVIDSMHGGGAESSLLEVVPGLRSRGVRTSIVTLLPDDGALDQRLHRLGLTPIRLEARNPVAVTLALRNLIRSEKPDLIHTTLYFSTLAGRVAARSLQTPVITTLANHDYGPEHRANSGYGAASVRAAQAIDRLTVPLTTRFHAISASVAQTMGRRLMIPEDRIQVVYRGRDPARLGVATLDRRLRTRAALSIEAMTPVVLSVGRLDRQKGVDTTIDAFRRLVDDIPDAVLLVAGRPGNASAVVQAKARGCPAVRFLGHRTDVPDLMCAADALSFPSRWEGLGGTLLEAMALRLPIVASDIPPLVEALGDVHWPLVRADDAEVLARELVSVLDCASASEANRDAGERRFRHFFTADAASEGMAELYREVLSNVGAHDAFLPLACARHADDPAL